MADADSSDMAELRKELSSLRRHLHIVGHHSKTIPLSITGFKPDQPNFRLSEPFYTQSCGHKLCLGAELVESKEAPQSLSLAIHACLMQGEFDSELEWPVRGKVTVQIRNQNGDAEHVSRSKQVAWQYRCVGDPVPIPVVTDLDTGLLSKGSSGEDPVRYLVRDTLQMTVKYMALEK